MPVCGVDSTVLLLKCHCLFVYVIVKRAVYTAKQSQISGTFLKVASAFQCCASSILLFFFYKVINSHFFGNSKAVLYCCHFSFFKNKVGLLLTSMCIDKFNLGNRTLGTKLGLCYTVLLRNVR